MKTEAIDFCKRYNESIENRKILEDEKSSFVNTYDKKLIDFYIVSKENARYENKIFLLKLDEEDLQYLYDKYSKKAEEELQENINELKEKYKL